MSVQLSDLIQHVSMGAVERAVGPGAFMVIRTGPAPEDTDEPDAGLILAVIELPDGWVSAAKGAHSVGPWGKFRARTTGTAGHFRIYANDGECCVQGRITADGDGGDVTLNILDYVPGRSGEITSFAFWKAEGQKPDRLRAKRIRILKSRARKAGIPWLEGEDPPAAGGDLKSIIDGLGLGTGLICCLDAGATASYPGTGQTWFDLTTNNADFYLGADGSAGADDPTFNGVAGALSEAEYWSGAGTFFTEAVTGSLAGLGLHNDNTAFTVMAVCKSDWSVVGEVNMLRNADVSPGIAFQSNSNALRFYNSSSDGGQPYQVSGFPLVDDVWTFAAMAFATATGEVLLVTNEDPYSLAPPDTAFTYPNPAEAASAPFTIMYNGMSAATRIAALAVWNTALTAANLEAIRAALKAGRFPSLYETP